MIEYKVKVHSDGTREWFNLNGKRHRVDGPAVEDANGYKSWYLNNQRHRVDGPAVESPNGYKLWYLNGERHRVDGPAMELANGNKYWYLNGKQYSEADFKLAVAKLNEPSDPCNGKEVSIDGKMYKLTAV